VTQVQIEFSKVAAPDLSAHARSRAASLPGTDDFASMIDAPSNDAAATAMHHDTRPAQSDHHSERSSSHRTDSTVASDRYPSRRSDRTEATPRVGDDSRPRAADRAADAADAGNASPPHKGADDGDDSDQRTGKTDGDGDAITGTAVASATPPAPVVAPVAQPNTLAPVVAPVAQPNILAPDGAPADNATTIAAATATASASAQTSDADAAPANAEHAQTADAGKSKSASLIAALAQKKLGAEPAAEDGEVASPDTADAGVGPVKTHVEEKIGKGSKIRAEGEAGATTQAGEGPAPDGQQIQPSQPDASDVAAGPPPATTEPSHKDAHLHLDSAAGTSSTKEHNDKAAAARTDALQIGAVQAAASPNNASATIGTEAGIAAAGSAAPGVAAVTTTTATSSPSDAASAPVTLADIGVKIAAQAKAGRRSFDIRLDPPELGHVHVRLDVDRDGNVISRLVVDRADTLDLLRRDAPQLQRALQDAGLKADAQTMQFSLRDQNAGQQGGYNTPHPAARTTPLDAGTRLDEVPLTYSRPPNRTGGLDIRI
jgi:flagellar hook-length control protein FliK